MYWAASCGGCEVSLVNLDEKLLELTAKADLVFCPCLLDAKRADVEAMPDGSIDATLFNGALRTQENVEMARLLRRKSKLLLAYGACASWGGVPALANLIDTPQRFWERVFTGPTAERGPLPQPKTQVPQGELELPPLSTRVKRLEDEVAVDYSIPGCPPESEQLWEAVGALLSGAPLPPRGTVLGAGDSAVCRECARVREGSAVPQLKRMAFTAPDPDRCLLEQGLVCMGPATRDGCGALCPKVGYPCAGCYGPAAEIRDAGAKMTGALGAAMPVDGFKGLTEEQVLEKIDERAASIPDWAGTFYKFTLGASPLRKKGVRK
jgi:F420-non-reducing hydrogenase small subunit